MTIDYYGLIILDGQRRIILEAGNDVVHVLEIIDVPANGYYSKTFSNLIALNFTKIFYTIQLVDTPADLGAPLVPNVNLSMNGINIGPASGSSVRCQVVVFAQ